MPARCERTIRPATREDLETLDAHPTFTGTNPDAVLFLSCVIVFCAGVGWAFGSWLGFAVGLVLGVGASVWLFRSIRRDSAEFIRLKDLDLKDPQIEVLSLTAASAIDIPSYHDSTDPTFAFELQNGQALLLIGEWLMDPRTYGGTEADVPAPDGEAEEFANHLLPPLAFPVPAFELHRFPNSGIVTRISLLSDYAAPEVPDGTFNVTALAEFQSQIIDRGDDDVLNAVTKAATASNC